ncbi:p53 and DNA damage-regulated protein 1-like [Acanthaster planci]|uniref:P53 and DNA damage-regulated protein 1-like n=1 Tax=Acanthaster planci TaxID=133434 RepID=A0A8B7XQV7_ACAPL|nr:p53 and DNA damage-regulated protein 1-like [Acanthaster planci]
MSRDTQFILKHLGELEQVAEEVLADKQQIVDLDRTRNGNREGLRCLMKQNQQSRTGESKSWICFGNMFIKVPGPSAQAMVEQDQKKLDEEIDRLHKELRPKVAKLRDLEGQKKAKGFDLTALSSEEIKAVKR